MRKKFNITGTCVPSRHYMVNLSAKLDYLFKLVEQGEYLTLSRPRQYGKTTVLSAFKNFLRGKPNYLPLQISFEGLVDAVFEDEERFCTTFIRLLERKLDRETVPELNLPLSREILQLFQVDQWIDELVSRTGKRVVLMIDEIDQSSGERMFFSFLGMLRRKYLERQENDEPAFHSVILAGVRDIKTLKGKIRTDDEMRQNSPWNIAVDFQASLSFSAAEIATMLEDYKTQTHTEIDIPEMAGQLFAFTSGYPFLVSRLCKIMDEELPSQNRWDLELLHQAVNRLLRERNTNAETLIKNLENDQELYNMVYNLLLMGEEYPYNEDLPVVKRGSHYGIFSHRDGNLRIHNRIYAERIYNYLSMKVKKEMTALPGSSISSGLIFPDGRLNFEALLLKFQAFMKEQYSERDKAFLEQNGRLIFLAFLKPILNGKGFDFKEAQISEEKRLDIVATYLDRRYIVELKLWYGPARHAEGLRQLCDYLERQNQDKGYLIIFDAKRKNKSWKQEVLRQRGKEIFAIWV